MWNTYSAGELNALLHLPDLVCLRVGLYDKVQKFLLEKMLWRNNADPSPVYENIERFGLHAEDGSYWDIDFKYKSFTVNMETACDGSAFACRLTPAEGSREQIVFFITATILGQKKGVIALTDTGFTITTVAGRYDIAIQGEREPETIVNASIQGVVIKASTPVTLTCNLSPSENGMALIASNREKCLKQRSASSGFLDDVADAIQKAMIWNTIYDASKDRLCIPVSRAWCAQNGRSFGSYVLFEWDTFFTSVMTAFYSPESARMQVASIFDEMTPDGMIPNFGSQRGGSPDRSQPPVGSYCLLKLYRQTGDVDLLKTYYPKLCIWHRWWFKNRDGNADGLLEWGSNPNPDGLARGFFDEGNTMLCAMYESGLDNSPMYDDVVFNTETHTMELNDIGLNALYALDCKCLAD
ncbi:MAG: hypothetical protein LBV27_05370, partial [Oscillospiraceae bacterium]|nr:hypothetical protein [Oscillospiraceae bacterium]